MDLAIVIIALVVIVGACSKKTVAPATCLNSKSVPRAVGVPINQNVLLTNPSVGRGAPQAQIEAAQNARPQLSDAQKAVVAGVGYDEADHLIEGLFA